MPTLIEMTGGVARAVEDSLRHISDDEEAGTGDVIVSLTRFQADGERLLAEGRRVGVRIAPGEEVEALAYDLPRLAVVAVEFPKHLDGRGYTSARLLRERLGFKGQVRAVGDVLREQAMFLVRCGFDAFEVSDGASAQEWQAAAGRYRHVYQRAADGRPPAFVEREG
jgi:uncharacterized protein (DUF934 family)